MTMQFPRASGVLLHPTSLPGPDGSGDFGADARRFVDWLAEAGQGLWQILPLNPVGPGHSPYMSPSAFAIDPRLVAIDELVRRGWLDADDVAAARTAAAFDAQRVPQGKVSGHRTGLLREAARRFFAAGGCDALDTFEAFCTGARDWLDDHALFMALADAHPGAWFASWPRALARREPQALAQARAEFAEAIDEHRFAQWVAHEQWTALRRYANARGVRIIGDVPIFVAPHSADVWAHPTLFDLDEAGAPRVIAGVPPDYFSETGQRWGNPLYRWDVHAATGFAWWIRRLRGQLAQADVVRIDHFRGFCAYWEVAADAIDARSGRWLPGPGAALFDALQAGLGSLPIIAEDLGTITPDVHQLRERFGLPGMRVLQFAFGDNAANLYLPQNYTRDSVVYTGTHDNDTSLGWFATASDRERRFAQTWLKTDGREIGWDLIHAASQSVAQLAIYPWQDVLELDSDARMNRPGIADGCWDWRFEWSQLRGWYSERLRCISAAHGRNGVVFD